MRVGIALGSNLGDRVAHLQAAVRALRELAVPPVRLSRIYETEPMDCPPGSPAFLNAVVEIGWEGDVRDLLKRLQSIEVANNRPADHGRNTPRTVDLDILYADDLVVNEPDLVLPHPRMVQRAFVLVPLDDVAPERRVSLAGKTVNEMRKQLPASSLWPVVTSFTLE